MVFLTPSAAAVSASRIQFEVITLGLEDGWSKITGYSKGYLFSSFENSYTVCIYSPVAVLPHQNRACVLKRQKNRFIQRAWQHADKVNWSEAIILRNVKLVAKKKTTVAWNYGSGSGYDKDKMRTNLYVLCSWHTLFFVVVVFFLFSLALLFVLYVSHKLNSIMLSFRLSVTHTACLHFHFSVRQWLLLLM